MPNAANNANVAYCSAVGDCARPTYIEAKMRRGNTGTRYLSKGCIAADGRAMTPTKYKVANKSWITTHVWNGPDLGATLMKLAAERKVNKSDPSASKVMKTRSLPGITFGRPPTKASS